MELSRRSWLVGVISSVATALVVAVPGRSVLARALVPASSSCTARSVCDTTFQKPATCCDPSPFCSGGFVKIGCVVGGAHGCNSNIYCKTYNQYQCKSAFGNVTKLVDCYAGGIKVSPAQSCAGRTC